MLRGDSHSESTVSKVKDEVGSGGIDFLLIDGDHTYEGVKRDYELYSGLVNEGGLIAFHDIAPRGEARRVGQVPIFWSEVKQAHSFEEIMENRGQTGYGIGVIAVGPVDGRTVKRKA